MDVEQLRQQIRPRLEQALGQRLRGILLFGSRARGDAEPDSDIDLMILLEPPVDYGRDLSTIIHAIYPFQLQIDPPLHPMPVDAEIFERGEYAIYRHAKEEGVPL